MDKKESKLEKLGKGLYFWFVPSSFWKYAKDYDEEIFPKNSTEIEIGTEKSRKSTDAYFAAGLGELLRLSAYIGLGIEFYKKVF